jgi:hypothetical protein
MQTNYYERNIIFLFSIIIIALFNTLSTHL